MTVQGVKLAVPVVNALSGVMRLAEGAEQGSDQRIAYLEALKVMVAAAIQNGSA